MDQVQDFTPTPMTTSSVMYYTGIDPRTMKPVFVERDPEKKKRQKSFFQKIVRGLLLNSEKCLNIAPENFIWFI